MDNDMQMTMAEENAVKDILKIRIAALHSYEPEGVEVLSYRLAEIMVLAKDLYTRLFPELMSSDVANEKEMWNQVMGIRMHLLHMKDCIEEFDGSLLELMGEREEESDEDLEDDENE